MVREKVKVDRSPNYPQITFTAALDFAKKIWEQEKKHVVSVDVALKHMGYNSRNGRSAASLSALRKYGLISYEGSGLRVTDDAATIFVYPSGTPEREGRIRELAMLPPLFKELVREFHGGLPSDANLSARLQTERNFSAEGAANLIKTLRHSLELAGVDKAATKSENRAESNPQERQTMTPNVTHTTPPPPSPAVQHGVPTGESHTWSLGGSVRAHLTITGELRPKNIKLLKQYVDLLAAASEHDEED